MSKSDDPKDRGAGGKVYEVGYGRPPKATRFAPGQSGNPRGRPKGATSFRASIKREMAEMITVREGDREIRIPKSAVLAKRMLEKALKGDLGAMRMLAAIDADTSQEVRAQDAAEASIQPMPDDEQILDYFFELARKGDVGLGTDGRGD